MPPAELCAFKILATHTQEYTNEIARATCMTKMILLSERAWTFRKDLMLDTLAHLFIVELKKQHKNLLISYFAANPLNSCFYMLKSFQSK